MTKMLSASAPSLTRGSAPGPRWGLCLEWGVKLYSNQPTSPHTNVIGSCSALAMVPPQPLTPSAAYARLSVPFARRIPLLRVCCCLGPASKRYRSTAARRSAQPRRVQPQIRAVPRLQTCCSSECRRCKRDAVLCSDRR